MRPRHRREASSSGELNQAIAPSEWNITERNRAGCKLDIVELGAPLEYGLADSFEVFVADDALEGGAASELKLFDDFELIGRVILVRAEQYWNAARPIVFRFLL